MGNERLSIFHIDTEIGWGGGQNQVSLLIEELLLRGYSNAIITPKKGKLWNSLSRISQQNKPGLIFIPVRQRNQIDLRGILPILRNIKKQDRGIIHLHSWRGNLLSTLLSFFSGCPLIMTRRINYPLGHFSAFLINRLKKVFLVAISESVKQSLIVSGVTKPIQVIRDGIKVENFIRRNSRRINKNSSKEEEICIGHVGSFNKVKGQNDLIDILADLTRRGIPARVLFAGEGEELPVAKELAKRKRLHDRVTFLGHVHPISDFLDSIDLLAVTSTVEGLGISAIEAMAAGLPIIAFNTGGLSEVIKDGVTGWLVPPRDVKAFSKALLRLIHDRMLRLRFGQEGKKRAAQHFSHLMMVRSYEKLYKKAWSLL